MDGPWAKAVLLLTIAINKIKIVGRALRVVRIRAEVDAVILLKCFFILSPLVSFELLASDAWGIPGGAEKGVS